MNGLNSSSVFGNPHCAASARGQKDHPSSRRACRAGSGGSAPALERIGEGLERTVVGAPQHAAAAAVVEQRVDRFLEHPLLVAGRRPAPCSSISFFKRLLRLMTRR